MSQITLSLLGRPVVERDGVQVGFDTRKAIALLALLAVTGREHTREQIAALLWPDSDAARSRSSLRRTLSVTAAAVGEGMAITRAAVALAPGVVHSDVAEFRTLVALGDTASLERAVVLYRDDFLTGFSLRGCAAFEDWQMSQADDLRQQLAGALERLADGLTAGGDLAAALVHARRRLSLDPLHEPAHQAVLRLQAWTGQRVAALSQYRALVRILDRDLAVPPLPETTRLYDDIRADRLAPPPTSTAAATRSSLHPAPRATAPQPPASAGGWPLVGRADELNALDAAWRQVGAQGRVVTVVGAAGCGKTRLVEEFGSAAAGLGAVVVGARCHQGESALPFAVATDLLRSACRASPGIADRLPAHAAAIAGRLVPELWPAVAQPAEPALDSPLALARWYAAIGEVLAAAAPPGPRRAIVVVEDLQWADGPSLELLGYLVRRLALWPVLLVLTWSAEAAEPLRGFQVALDEARAAGLDLRIEPGPLAADDIAALLSAADIPNADPGPLITQTRGLPMLVREYVEGFRAAAPGDQTWWPPASVRDLFRRRVNAASAGTVQMLTAAAVIGTEFDADLLRTVSGRGEAQTVEALEEALERFLLTELGRSGRRAAPSYAFPYEALRRVVYDTATSARRRLLHARAADALARRHERDPAAAPAATVAGHLQAAARDAEAAQWWWRAAGRARELYAPEQAHAYLREAAALGYPQVEVSVALGEVLTVLGRYREALSEFESAASGAQDSRLATIEHKLAEVHHRLGDWELADTHLAVAAELLDGADAARRAALLADRAVIAYRRGLDAPARRLGQEALDVATGAGDPAATAQALNVLGMLAARAGRSTDAENLLRASLQHARSSPDPASVVAALNNLSRLLSELGRGPEAMTLAREALQLGDELGDRHRIAALHNNLADLLHASGQTDAALEHLKEAARRFAGVDSGTQTPEIWMLVEW